MNARLTRHIGSLFAVAILAGCAAPGSSDLSAANQQPGNNFLSTNDARAVAPLAYASKLQNVPAVADAKPAEAPSLANAAPITSGPDVSDFEQHGRASWYGPRFHGRKTASGERFDMHALTAAHRSLPLASWIRVTNTANHKTVVVKVNDRGPYAKGRILDLSYAAAAALGMRGSGTGNVKIEGLTQQEAREARAEYASTQAMN
ncbi:septal ring lytic transglycosylase RlpA family protein [Caballeronia humi]|uniref:Endolytic peptidoglycan transglycosylase RlpA n=1 Tax=Caballeronia humi TaxID=326474 RepID=A0A158GHW0_9BURK|nr:septal ring lytic transglycosylase RlpA family protein [Caballeronia humi]SAL31000.1 rare lipoprotein A [Caballeronia humi]